MALALILIYRHFRRFPSTSWLHVADHLAKIAPTIRGKKPARFAGGDPVKLRHWGLLDGKNALRPDGSDRNGLYRITPLGRAFVEGTVTVLSHVFDYNNTFLGLTGRRITIQAALKQNFDYTELMTP
jgi:hypothetical protein